MPRRPWRHPGCLAAVASVVFVVALAVLTAGCSCPAHRPPEEPVPARSLALQALQERAASLSSDLEPVAVKAESRVFPLAEHLRGARWRCRGTGCADSAAVDRIALAIVRHAERLALPVDTVVGVLMVENPWLDTTAVSFAGARGLFQVMPFHAGTWGCGGRLEAVEDNVCKGLEILASYLSREQGRAWTRALLRYNGCVSTPGCERYPDKVRAAATQTD